MGGETRHRGGGRGAGPLFAVAMLASPLPLQNGRTGLWHAAHLGRQAIVRMLLGAGANACVADTVGGQGAGRRRVPTRWR